MKTIRVETWCGMVQSVKDVPSGIQVKVYDYDRGENKDEDGNLCSMAIYKSQDLKESKI